MRWLRPLLFVVPLAGCQWLIGADDRPECSVHAGDPLGAQSCPPREVCQAGRCVPEVQGEGLDARADALGDPDAEPDFAEPDATPPDAEPVEPDLAVDAEVAHPADPYPEGLCFAHESGVVAAAQQFGAHVPWAACTPAGVLWTTAEGAEVALWVQRGADAAPERLLTFAEAPDLVVHDATVLFVQPHTRAPGQTARNVGRLDVRTGLVDWPSAVGATQSQPALSADLLGFVQDEGDRRAVHLLPAGGPGLVPCGRAGVDQWGLAVGPGQAAWFERDARGRVSIGLSLDATCQARLTVAASPGVAPDARLHWADDALFWLQPDPDGLGAVWRLDLADLARGPHMVGPPRVHHVAVSAQGAMAAAARYRPGGYRIDRFDPRAPETRRPLPGSASVRRPLVSGRYLMWAQQDGAQVWMVGYRRVP